MEKLLITIDGTSGVGKGTLAKLLSEEYNLYRLDSGAIYRAAALYLQEQNFNLESDLQNYVKVSQICSLLEKLPLEFRDNEQGVLQVYVNGKNITQVLRLEQTGVNASLIGAVGEIRQALLARQKKYADDYPRLVAEGRDMGTVVFPNAELKFFLDASPEEKARRRYTELKEKGEKVTFEEILERLNHRDVMNKNRKVAPTIPAVDAIVIDTTTLDIEQVFALVKKHIDSYLERK